jgi:hypothetical protein
MGALDSEDVDDLGVFENSEARALTRVGGEGFKVRRSALAHIQTRNGRHAEFEKSEPQSIPPGRFVDRHEIVSAQRFEKAKRGALVKPGVREVGETFLDRTRGQNFEKQDGSIEKATGIGLLETWSFGPSLRR